MTHFDDLSLLDSNLNSNSTVTSEFWESEISEQSTVALLLLRTQQETLFLFFTKQNRNGEQSGEHSFESDEQQHSDQHIFSGVVRSA